MNASGLRFRSTSLLDVSSSSFGRCHFSVMDSESLFSASMSCVLSAAEMRLLASELIAVADAADEAVVHAAAESDTLETL